MGEPEMPMGRSWTGACRTVEAAVGVTAGSDEYAGTQESGTRRSRWNQVGRFPVRPLCLLAPLTVSRVFIARTSSSWSNPSWTRI